MAEAFLVSVLQAIGASLAASAVSTMTSKPAENISVDDRMKKIESEFKVMKALIRQEDLHKTNNETFEAWFRELRKVAYEAEDIVDEYAYLTMKQQTSGKTGVIRNIADKLRKLEGRLQHLTSMKNKYNISITERGESSNANYDQRVSESPYITSEDDDIVGFQEESKQLLKWLTDEGWLYRSLKLRQKKNDDKKGLRIISIYGREGLGKTTLARSIYKSEKIKRHFDCIAWVSVSQNYQVNDLFRRIGMELLGKNQTIPDGDDTLKTLQSHLQGRGYLIFLDDMRNNNSWLHHLQQAFVENNCGSRVVITTRSEDVALLADKGCQIKLTTLPKEEAWGLFCKKAFQRPLDKNRCPKSLKGWAEKIVERCQGLPLAIVAIGSLLAYRERKEEEWKSFYDNLNSQLDNNSELNLVAQRVLELSIMDLSSYLKICFLYCGLFPEDYKIERDWIIRLWIAEGFIEDRGSRMTTEEVGELYINELVHRCLLQVVERDDSGKVDKLQLHDVVREITLTKSRKEMFGIAYDNPKIIQLGDEARRVFINGGSKTMLQPSAGSLHLRSFLSFDNKLSSSCLHNVSSSWKFLRVLSLRGTNIDKVPNRVAELFNLHYLDLSHTKVKTIPSWLGKLLKLQTLDLSYTRVLKLPKEVTKLQKLSHLFMIRINVTGSFDYFSDASVPDEICNIISLQSLCGIKASKVLVQTIGNLTLLSELTILKMRGSYCEALWASLAKMPRLRRLRVAAREPNEILILEKLGPIPSLQDMDLNGKLEIQAVSSSIFFSSLKNLRDLRMGWSGLCEDPLPALYTMSNLVTLNLYRAYDGQRLAFLKGWFPKLKTLALGEMPQLERIDITDGTMKNLQKLYLSRLHNLRIVPEGIKYLKSIQKMFLLDMAEVFMERIRGSDREIVGHIPNIDCL